MLVLREWCFLVLVLILWVPAVMRYIDLRRWGKYQASSLGLRFGMLPSDLPVLDFRASGFQPNRLKQG